MVLGDEAAAMRCWESAYTEPSQLWNEKLMLFIKDS